MVSKMRYETIICGTNQEIEHEQLVSAPLPTTQYQIADVGGGPIECVTSFIVGSKGHHCAQRIA